MTLADVAPRTTTSGELEYQAVQAGLWVARRDGVFAGMIEQRWGQGFTVTTALGATSGLFDTIDEAKAALQA
jgi:hypothetical protein